MDLRSPNTNTTVVQPCLHPPEGQRRIDVVTRLRFDARLYRAKVANWMGRPRKWGRRLPAPHKHEQWDVPWQKSRGYIYGRERTFQYKQQCCYWAVSGPNEMVHAFVFQVDGYKEPWYIVTTALTLSPEQVVAVFAARFRQALGGARAAGDCGGWAAGHRRGAGAPA